MSTSEMIRSHPNPTDGLDVKLLAEALEASAACATICSSCADACLGEESVADLRDCIRTDLDCADVCAATAALLSRRTGSNLEVVKAQLVACRTGCAACADDCEQHADMHEHCRLCAEACRRCEKACADLLAAIG
ncbi:four-helix bundle copper-binding protein [Dietzia cinnamea]|uniref:Four-helix bundle copper-binding protein n=1 Tax=Dietzia cinnamea TaxID=321318 RepID=A0ABV3YF81_9ACTN|nr:four-helix bundle copper-binding protein [Dietzia cinnamea]MCT2173742.1 four-helix bundle copper-binding protein [Dietzia cinnamea]